MTKNSGNIVENKLTGERYNILFNKAAIPASLTKVPENVFVEINESFQKIFGYSREDVIGKTSLELGMVRPEEREQTIKDIQKHGFSYNLEKHIYTKSGEMRIVIINVNAFELEGGKYVITTLQDITERKFAERRVLQLKRLYAILSQINQTIARVKERSELYQSICNVSARFGEFSLAWICQIEEETGILYPVVCNGGKLKSIPFQGINISDPAYKNDITCQAFRQNKTVTRDDVQNDPGMVHWHKQSVKLGYSSQAAVPVRLKGKPIGVLNLHSTEPGFFDESEEKLLLDEISLDISYALDAIEIEKERIRSLNDLKLLQEKLQIREGMLKLFVEYAPAAIAMFDREMKYLAVSRRFVADYHLKKQEITGHTHYEIFPEIGERWKAIHRNCLAGATEKADKDPFFRMDGSLDWIRWEIHPWYEKSGEIGGIILFSEVITERIQAEEQIKKLNEELERRVVERTKQFEEANKELESFSYSVSHDLRAPLRAMAGFARILHDSNSSSLDEEGNRMLQIITDNAKKMGDLIDDLLAFSRLGKLETHFTVVNMHDLAESVYHDLVPEKEKINFILHNIPPAFGDESMIKQVWVNLIGNAIKFSSLKEDRIIEIDGHVNGTENIYSVKDNGAGFDMKYVKKLFGVFQRLHSANQFEGTGVGLAIVQRIILRLNGRVWAEGIEDAGAEFCFTLPNNLNS